MEHLTIEDGIKLFPPCRSLVESIKRRAALKLSTQLVSLRNDTTCLQLPLGTSRASPSSRSIRGLSTLAGEDSMGEGPSDSECNMPRSKGDS